MPFKGLLKAFKRPFKRPLKGLLKAFKRPFKGFKDLQGQGLAGVSRGVPFKGFFLQGGYSGQKERDPNKESKGGGP